MLVGEDGGDGGVEPVPKRVKRVDGNLDLVDKSVLKAAQDQEEWIAARRRNWPTRQRIAEREAEKQAQIHNNAANMALADQDPELAKGGPEGEATPANAPSRNSGLSNSGPTARRRPLCRYFMRGRCNAGDQCRFSHDKPELRPARPAHERVYKRYEAPLRNSLFVKLVQNDHDAEDEVFVDFVDYLYKKGLI